MVRKYGAGVLAFFLVLGPWASAQAKEMQSAVDYNVNKMKTVLQLTKAQVQAVYPIVQDYLVKREAVLQQVAGGGLLEHGAVKSAIQKLKEEENKRLSLVLSREQMKKWINRENILASLNPDGNGDSDVDDGPSFTPEGASFKF
ncbi:MAG: hypothetical protein KGJ09_01835 [Candidatus Omnitrophica bacterium]|nr:hypothetical protein [Candidatus Omnitrophota bacterium]MDE2008799.1 hypothetical protein [Candidatus Omnitrophota bacterium]MDE2213638.1 hypothetical protein [Candidatus Omnitrophota bacterium]MDE2230461.1 hypothetical protein [Candidatus Omnitrophota bacterium]